MKAERVILTYFSRWSHDNPVVRWQWSVEAFTSDTERWPAFPRFERKTEAEARALAEAMWPGVRVEVERRDEIAGEGKP